MTHWVGPTVGFDWQLEICDSENENPLQKKEHANSKQPRATFVLGYKSHWMI